MSDRDQAMGTVVVSGMRRETVLAIYSAGNFGKNLAWTAAEVSLLFVMTNTLKLSAAASGCALLLALLADAALSVAVGAAIARSRRGALARSMALIAAPACGAAFAALYAAPAFGWPLLAIVGAVGFRAAYALLDVPHNLLMMSVAGTPRERSRVASYRFIFATLGAFFVATALLPAFANAGSADSAKSLLWFGIAGGLAVAVTVSAAVAVARPLVDARPPVDAGAALRPPTAAALPALYAIAVISGLTVPMFARVVLFDTTAVWSRDVSPHHLLVAIAAGQFAGAAVLVWLVPGVDRVRVLRWSHVVAMIACAVLIMQALSGDRMAALPAMILCGMLGVGIAGIFSVPWALLCSQVDTIERRYGRRCDAQAFGWLLAALKIGTAIGTALIAWYLWVVGYSPAQPLAPAVARSLILGGFAVPLAGSVACVALSYMLSCGEQPGDRCRTAASRR